tara:strand:- start:899 stop:1102 length:204 start_codon:yes stop_codon:yes gene_type:complete
MPDSMITPGQQFSRLRENNPQPKEEKVRGLGDVLAKFFAFIGIKKRKGCGCQKRQNLLNKIFPFKVK